MRIVKASECSQTIDAGNTIVLPIDDETVLKISPVDVATWTQMMMESFVDQSRIPQEAIEKAKQAIERK